MSSSGLIYAVIVGAWAAYLVPMWLRRQDELNEARPTERFSTAIRLLSGRAGMERRYARALENSGAQEHRREQERTREAGECGKGDNRLVESREDSSAGCDRTQSEPIAASRTPDHVDVRSLAVPVKPPKPASKRAEQAAPAGGARKRRPAAPDSRNRRAQVLARRRRTTTVLFLAFTAGTVAAAVGGLAFLWAPGVPGALLTSYIAHLRRQERRRFEVKLDRRRAAEAAKRLREQRAPVRPDAAPPAEPAPAPAPDPHEEARAVVEQTDHAEWVDGLKRADAPAQDSWDPVPVPLPTYVTAPVAPRVPDDPRPPASSPSAPPPDEARAREQSRGLARRARERGSTPLFDQYNNPADRPRAANE